MVFKKSVSNSYASTHVTNGVSQIECLNYLFSAWCVAEEIAEGIDRAPILVEVY